MNSVVREAVDIRIAFLSRLKKKSPVDIKTSYDQVVESAGPEVTHRRFLFKNLLRPIAAIIYRFLKPAVRPVAFRVRRYLVDGLRLEIQQELQRASAATTQQIEQELQRTSAATAQQIQQELRRISAAISSEVHYIEECLCSRLDRVEQYAAATARRVAINCGSGEVLVRTEVGFLLCAASDHALISCLLDTGELERGTRVLIQRYLKPGDVYVDVGANVGMHILAAARAMQGRGKIIAFEPFEPTMRMLEKTVWMNGFSSITDIHQAAVSNAAGRRDLFIGATSGHHSLFVLEPSPNNAQGPVDVPLVRLDGVIASGQRIDLLKIDAEGAELEVIEGGTSLIVSNPDIALIVEFGPSHLRRVGRTPSQWFASFTELGLDYRVINQESGALESWSLDALESSESVNLFIAGPDSAAWSRLL